MNNCTFNYKNVLVTPGDTRRSPPHFCWVESPFFQGEISGAFSGDPFVNN